MTTSSSFSDIEWFLSARPDAGVRDHGLDHRGDRLPGHTPAWRRRSSTSRSSCHSGASEVGSGARAGAATTAPARSRIGTNPCSSSRRYARATVLRFTPRSDASVRTAGSAPRPQLTGGDARADLPGDLLVHRLRGAPVHRQCRVALHTRLYTFRYTDCQGSPLARLNYDRGALHGNTNGRPSGRPLCSKRRGSTRARSTSARPASWSRRCCCWPGWGRARSPSPRRRSRCSRWPSS